MKVLILESFYNKKRYISPEEEIQIYYETNELLKIWKDIILNHSNDRITDLTRDKQEIINRIIPYLYLNNGKKFNSNKGLAPQLDRKIIEIILWGSSNFVSQSVIIDEIFRKTKSSMFQYFHHDLIVNAYLRIRSTKSALNVIDSMIKKSHTAYYYAVLQYDLSAFSNKEFVDELNKYQQQAVVKLLSRGESVSLNNVSFNDLIQLVKKVQGNIPNNI